jgi:hypothetical protein
MAIVADNQQQLIIVEQITELHLLPRTTFVAASPLSGNLAASVNKLCIGQLQKANRKFGVSASL